MCVFVCVCVVYVCITATLSINFLIEGGYSSTRRFVHIHMVLLAGHVGSKNSARRPRWQLRNGVQTLLMISCLAFFEVGEEVARDRAGLQVFYAWGQAGLDMEHVRIGSSRSYHAGDPP